MRAGRPERARERDEERRVLVAVADAGPQDLERRGQADGRLLLEQLVHVAHQPLRPLARTGSTRGRLPCFGHDLGRVALDERLGREEAGGLRIERTEGCSLQVADLEGVAGDRLARAVQVRRVQAFRILQAHPQALDRARVVDALRRARHHGGRLQHVAADVARHAQLDRALLRLAHDHEPERALLLHHLARVRDPRERDDARRTARGRGRRARAGRRRSRPRAPARPPRGARCGGWPGRTATARDARRRAGRPRPGGGARSGTGPASPPAPATRCAGRTASRS